jgi:hypothetical protein
LNKFHRIIIVILTVITLPLATLVGTVSFLWGAWWLGVALIVAGYGIGRRKARLIGMAFVGDFTASVLFRPVAQFEIEFFATL